MKVNDVHSSPTGVVVCFSSTRNIFADDEGKLAYLNRHENWRFAFILSTRSMIHMGGVNQV